MATKGLQKGSKTALTAGKKAARTRAYNKLQTAYNNATSSGVKASIKRKMNLLPTLLLLDARLLNTASHLFFFIYLFT